MIKIEVKVLTNKAGNRRVSIICREDRLYQFVEERFWPGGVEDDGWIWMEGWEEQWTSGLFQTAEEAEHDARRLIPWLRGNNAI